MKRVFIIYNPRSSRFGDVKKEVLSKVTNLKGCIIGKYEVQNTDVDDNAIKLSKFLKNGDLVISAGGDATGIIASNAILRSKKDATLAVLPYGNFNDLAHTLGTKSLDDIFTENSRNPSFEDHKLGRTPLSVSEKDGFGYSSIKWYPLEIYVDGKFFRYATCYVTIGMMAEAVHIYDQPKMRKKLKKPFGRKISSYTNLASWYFKNRHKKQFLPEFKLNGELQPKKTSDYAAINGCFLARVMKSRAYYQKPHLFLHQTDQLINFWRLFKLMFRSIFFFVPSSETKYDILEFLEPGSVEIQAEGEYKMFKNVKKIEIKKSDKFLKVVHR